MSRRRWKGSRHRACAAGRPGEQVTEGRALSKRVRLHDHPPRRCLTHVQHGAADAREACLLRRVLQLDVRHAVRLRLPERAAHLHRHGASSVAEGVLLRSVRGRKVRRDEVRRAARRQHAGCRPEAHLHLTPPHAVRPPPQRRQTPPPRQHPRRPGRLAIRESNTRL